MTAAKDDRPFIPVPDPTLLTTEALQREIGALKELLQNQIKDDKTLLLALIKDNMKLVNKEFILIESRRVEQKKDTKDAVDAALSAAKEAVKEQTTASERSIGKSETATREQLKQMGDNFKAEMSGLASTQTDLKERVVAIESGGRAVQETKTERGSVDRFAVSIVSVAAVIVLGIAGFLVSRPAITAPSGSGQTLTVVVATPTPHP